MPLDALLLWFSERPDPLCHRRAGACHNAALAVRVVTDWPTPHLPPSSVQRDRRRVKESPGTIPPHKSGKARIAQAAPTAVSPTAEAFHAPPAAGHDHWNQGSGLPLGSVHWRNPRMSSPGDCLRRADDAKRRAAQANEPSIKRSI